jgi:DNA primase catalytic core
MYTEKSIDLVRNADIVAIISSFCELKRSGSKWTAVSPFNGSKDSFFVTPSLNMYKCFSTGKGGDGISFIKNLKNTTFSESVKIIGEICGLILEEEEITEEAARKKSYKQELYDLTATTAIQYEMQLQNLPADHWAKEMVAKREINAETIEKFKIGFAPKGFQFVTKSIIERGKLELAKTAGLVSAKEGRSFDFFVDKLIFPILDERGNVVAFGGRKSDGVDGPKYINTAQTDIYNKSYVLYGLYQNKMAIAKAKTAVLVEGYTDVTGLSQHGCELAVASCGTALSEVQCKILHRIADHVIICRDNDGVDAQGNDQKGTLAALRDINILLSEGFKVSICILPEGEDPDSFAKKIITEKVVEASKRNLPINFSNISEYIDQEAQDAVIWKTQKLKNKASNDPDALSDAVTEIAQMLFSMKDDVKRTAYLDMCRKLLKLPAKTLKDKIDSFVKVAEVKSSNSGEVGKADAETLGLPEGADYKQYFEKGYVLHDNCVYFKGRGPFYKGSNFKITPLFHVYGKQDNKRLCEVISDSGKKKIIDFDSSDFGQMAKFENKLLDEGNFVFSAEVTPNQFKLLRNDILNNFVMAYELKTLGWQQEGFYAFANCVNHNGMLKKPNDYGIIQLETGVQNESEYMEDIKHFYSPSASVMYKYSRDGDDPYENDRYFVYKEAPIALHTWMKQLNIVYPKKSVTGIAFLFATLFRDIYLKRYQFFPHLFFTGEKGSGKSKFGESLVALFTYKQEPFDLNSGTPVAFYRRLARTMNAPTMLEEYHDGVDDKIFQPLKGAYDGRGREMGKATGDNRTSTTKVNCSLIILSQYLSSRDDNSLTSRSIVEHFIKPQESFTNEQIEDYSKLKSWEEEGLSSLLVEILKHRPLVEANIHTTYAAINKKMKADLKNNEYQERMLQNYVALLTPMKILWEQFTFPFTYDEMYKQFREAIIDSSDLIIESEGLAEFWRTLEYLLDRSPFPLLKNGMHFIIDTPTAVSFQTRKGEKDNVWENKNRTQVLFLRLNAVHQLYHKEVSTREGTEVIGENTLRNYFKSKKYFLGSVKSHRFDDTSTSAYAFDYSMMHEGGVLNLIRKVEKQSIFDKPEDKDEKDDLPY